MSPEHRLPFIEDAPDRAIHKVSQSMKSVISHGFIGALRNIYSPMQFKCGKELGSPNVKMETNWAPHGVTVQPPPAAPERTPVPTFEFSTLGLPLQEQFLAWRSSYAPIIDLMETDNGAGFAGEQKLWDLGSLAFSRVRTEPLAFVSLDGRVRRDPIDHWLISLMLKGSSKTVAPSRTFEGHAGAVQIHRLGKAFEGRFTDSEMLQLFVPRDFFRGMTHVLDAAEFSTHADGMAKLLADHMIGLARCLQSLDVRDLPRLVSATRAIILACIEPSPDHLDEASGPIANILLERARLFVQANIVSHDLSVTSLQRELGISRSRLYRLFEPYGGVFHYIQRRRLLDAHAALADPRDTRRILDIADERGFSDASEFSRAFKREFGYTPSEVRAGGMRHPPTRPDADLEHVSPRHRLGILLRRLQD